MSTGADAVAAERPFAPPETETEEVLVEICSKVLGVEKLSVMVPLTPTRRPALGERGHWKFVSTLALSMSPLVRRRPPTTKADTPDADKVGSPRIAADSAWSTVS